MLVSLLSTLNKFRVTYNVVCKQYKLLLSNFPKVTPTSRLLRSPKKNYKSEAEQTWTSKNISGRIRYHG